MSNENFAADPEGLGRSGKRFSALKARVEQLERDVNNIAVGYPDAAGDGEYRKSFDKSYVPMVVKAQEYMTKLSGSVDEFGDDTVSAAEVFSDTDTDATSNARRH